jgi:Uma2 family endonuclease
MSTGACASRSGGPVCHHASRARGRHAGWGEPLVTRATAQAMSAEELLRLPDDDCRHELVEGELRTMTPGGAEHGEVASHIGFLLRRHVAERGLGRVFAAETGFVLARSPDTVRAPDAAFVGRARAEGAGRVTGYWPGPPDLAVEVVSPGDAYSEVHEKALSWLGAGTKLVLVVDPSSRRATRYASPQDVATFAGDERVDCEAVVPGFAPRAGELFP